MGFIYVHNLTFGNFKKHVFNLKMIDLGFDILKYEFCLIKKFEMDNILSLQYSTYFLGVPQLEFEANQIWWSFDQFLYYKL